MVRCSTCGREIEKVPAWLASVRVQFVCAQCSAKQSRGVPLTPPTAKPAFADASELDDLIAEDLETD